MSTVRSASRKLSRHDPVTVRLPDGDWVSLRPLQPGEVEALLAVFDGMSIASRASRYLVGMPRLPATMLASLVDVDGHEHVAWVAGVDRRPVGIARYVRVAPATVEVAFEVVDAWQGRGVGTMLLDAVTTVAAAHGVRRLRASVHPANAASVHLLARVGMRLTLNDGLLEGESVLRLLDRPRVDRRAVVDLAAWCGGESPSVGC